MIPSTKREELNEIFVELLGSRNVYFQPDANVKMRYPAIVYSMDDQATIYANNGPFRRTDGYQVTCIDWDSSVPVRRKIEQLNARFTRTFVKDGLYHWIYNLYF